MTEPAAGVDHRCRAVARQARHDDSARPPRVPVMTPRGEGRAPPVGALNAVETGRAVRRMEREAETERIYVDAEAYTRGNWVNAKGRARSIADREILTGRQDLFQRYASDEAREYFRERPRPTAAYFRGDDTRITYKRPGYASTSCSSVASVDAPRHAKGRCLSEGR
jgi:hypothetical protein